MDNTLHIAAIWLHIFGIALFVGPQFFLAFAWVPASRQIEPLAMRVTAMRTITHRFGYIGGAGLVLILIAGTYLISTWRDFYAIPEDEPFTGLRYGVLFIIKMTVLLVMLAMLGLHTFLVGPRLVDAIEAQANGRGSEAEVSRLRRYSMFLSIGGLVLTLAIMIMGVMMNTTEFSFEET
ncbi:MAG: CopD family protein [Dehalococcoidia bacterium]|nr:CopD family protein [Dehalococcoidia bacterium]